ncbi:MAG: hypothetical protein JW918_04725 [Anaerolineae bacterium]|nr:hypothetical protein [Anaerolineae bacterium]
MTSTRLASEPRLAPSVVICTVVPGVMTIVTPALIKISPVTVIPPGPQVSSLISVPLIVEPPGKRSGAARLRGGAVIKTAPSARTSTAASAKLAETSQ